MNEGIGMIENALVASYEGRDEGEVRETVTKELGAKQSPGEPEKEEINDGKVCGGDIKEDRREIGLHKTRQETVGSYK